MSTYSFQDVQCSLAGVGANLDLGAGSGNAAEGITITHAGEENAMTIGADGTGMHTLKADRSGKVTLRYLKTSPMNAALMSLRNTQKAGGAAAGWGQNTIALVNGGAPGENITCDQCAFKKVPDLTYANEASMVEWEFDAIAIYPTLGVYL